MARPGLRQHPKFRRLVFLLGLPEPHVYGCLEFIWETSYQSGDPLIGDQIDVELAACWTGEPGKLCAALLDCRLLDQRPDGRYEVHDLWHHAPDYVVKRHQREQGRKNRYAPRSRPLTAEWRNSDNGELGCLIPPNSELGGQGVPNAELGQTPAPAPAPNKESAGADSCSEPAAPASEPNAKKAGKGPKAKDESPVVLTFPVDGPGPKEWSLTEAKLAEYRGAYPALDVLAECRDALQWVLDNPERKKTAKGMARYLGGWLRRSQDKGRGSRGVRPAAAAPQLPAVGAEDYDRAAQEKQALRAGAGLNGPARNYREGA